MLHEYVEYIPQVVDTSRGMSSHIDGTVLILERLDALLSTVTYCFCDNGIDVVGGHRQKLHSDTFSSFFSIAVSQLIKTVATVVLK